jgi:hypothetical protein
MVNNYVKRQDTVKAMQFSGLKDVDELAGLLGFVGPQVCVKVSAEGYEIQFNDSAPICLRTGVWVVKSKDDLEVLEHAEFGRKYIPEDKHYPLIGTPLPMGGILPCGSKANPIKREGDTWL